LKEEIDAVIFEMKKSSPASLKKDINAAAVSLKKIISK